MHLHRALTVVTREFVVNASGVFFREEPFAGDRRSCAPGLPGNNALVAQR